MAMMAADAESARLQLSLARAELDQERRAKTLLAAIAEEHTQNVDAVLTQAAKVEAALTGDIDALKSQLDVARSELAEERTARASRAADAEALAAQLGVTCGELDEARRAIASLATKAEILESKLASAEAEVKCARKVGHLHLPEVRAALEMRMKAAWQQAFQELDEAPHRTHASGPSALRAPSSSPRLPGVSPRVLPVADLAAMAGGTTPRSGGSVRFAKDQALVSPVSVTSYRELKESLWVVAPESSVMCDKCEKRVPQIMGCIRKMPDRPQFMNDEFLCAECNREEVLASARPASSPPRSSPLHRTTLRSRSRSSSNSSNSNSIPRSATSPSASPTSRRRLRRGKGRRGDRKPQPHKEGGPMKRKHEGKKDRQEGKDKKRPKEKTIAPPDLIT